MRGPPAARRRRRGAKAVGANAAGGPIPPRYTCGGEGASPALAWTAGPPGTAAYALLMEDLDIPGGGVFTHWWVRNIPAGVTSVEEGKEPLSGETDPDRGYFGPCPPRGEPHRYLFKVLALDEPLPIEPGMPSDQLRSHVLAHAFFVGLFSCPTGVRCSA